MKNIFNNILISVFLFLLLITQEGCQTSDYEKAGDTRTYYFAVEVNGAMCGYSEFGETPVIREGKRFIMLDHDTRISMKLMGKEFQTNIHITRFVDSLTMQPLYSEVKIDQGNIHIHSRMTVEDSLVTFYDVNEDKSITILVQEGTVIENDLYYPGLVTDFYNTGQAVKMYPYLDEKEQKVEGQEYTFEGMDTLFLAGNEYVCMRFSQVGSNGLVAHSWIDPQNGFQLRSDIPGGGMNIYLSDYRVKEMVSTIAMDDILFYRVNRVIPDFKNMTYMKVEVNINTVGENITPESLNFPGQRFEGVVENNFVTGTFEIQPVRYDGRDGPAFPYDHEVPEDMKKYLEPEVLIESDDAEIAQTARYLTKDASDAWDAAMILSRWVSDNISGALPGGGSARGTFQMRQAECGGHSRLLTAMCRAVGIPARLALGGMYVPDNNGFFGQHAWTEVYMGEAGWIPVDATIGEVDYIDAGHIRLGEKSTFHPKMMEIVEYRLR